MRNSSALALGVIICGLLVGCMPTMPSSHEKVTNHIVSTQSWDFPEDALYMGDADGDHHFKLRSIYSWVGDREFTVPASRWELPVTFPLTDDASKWQSVSWVDRETFERSNFAYAALTPSKEVETGHMPAETMPTTMHVSIPDMQLTTLPSEPTTQPATAPTPETQK